MGSASIGAWIAQVVFWLLLVRGSVKGDLTARVAVAFVILWLLAFIGFPNIPYEAVHSMFPVFVAILDIALVFAVIKGDVRLT